MMLKNTPYRWLAYMVGWFIFESFIGYSKRHDLTQESFTVFFFNIIIGQFYLLLQVWKRKREDRWRAYFYHWLSDLHTYCIFYICSGIGSKYDALGL